MSFLADGDTCRGQALDEIHAAVMARPCDGKVADYIPALASVDANRCGIAFATLDGEMHAAGDANIPFSIQSISKVFGLVLAMQRMGDDIWQRVGMEPSGQPFNSIVQLEWEHGIPRNPFINAGAILVADTLVSHFSSSRQAFLSFVRRLAGCERCDINEEVLASESRHGSRNAALAHLMKSFGNIEAEVDDVLSHYFFQCSLEMSCTELAQSLLFLANRGVHPLSAERVTTPRDAHRVNAILSTSGMYDQSGQFAFSVGLPAKSGVGGGIVAIVPGLGVISAWSPALNKHGNSTRALTMITELAGRLGLSIY
ncbi:glutaminase [Halomonas sp. MCCC 1A11036]|uniref:Glutaminase n=1 Tax=Billgrantia zhangzhouensis TaxID=2733481 RepID=A0ABS9AA08_9GAMM|nr:glutaminase [Halomonas zhangzhouensis]MCE8018584.1 glutaminase [Halomonas zhangzhouensis]